MQNPSGGYNPIGPASKEIPLQRLVVGRHIALLCFLFLCVTLAFLTVTSLYAQPPANTDGIQLILIDEHGNAVPHAKVTVTSHGINTHVRVTGETDSTGTFWTGTFSIDPVPFGEYLVEVAAKGFETLEKGVLVNQAAMTGVRLKAIAGNENVFLSMMDDLPSTALWKTLPQTITLGEILGLPDPPAAQQQPPAATQNMQGVMGWVTDHSLVPVPNAKVTLTNTATGAIKTDESSVKGDFLLFPPPPGNYNIEVVAKGFQRLREENIKFESGQSVGVTLKLTPASQYDVSKPAPHKAEQSSQQPAQPPAPVRVSSGTMGAYNVKMVRPIYPSEAKSGQVVLRVTISKQGDVTQVTPVAGSPILITAAIDAVEQWKYKPYVLNGQPVEVDTTIRLGADFAVSATDKPTPVESYVYEVALRFRIIGSSVVSGTCTEEEGVSASSLPLPLAGSFNSLDNALTALVHTDPNLKWSRGADGKWRVRDSRISDDILGVHLHNLRISNAAGIDEAIWQLMCSPDIKTAFAKNNIEHGIVPPGIMGNTKGMPRFSLQRQDTTLEAALDQVMTFYPGVWMYSECRSGQTRRITVRGEPTGWPSGGRFETACGENLQAH
jgi:TonB family protein